MGTFPGTGQMTSPFFPVISANSVTMATVSSAMTSYGFLGNCSQCSDIIWSPWWCSMRPGRKYFKGEDRSGRTKEDSGKSKIKDNADKNMRFVRRTKVRERNRWTEDKDRQETENKWRRDKREIWRNTNYYLLIHISQFHYLLWWYII